MAGCAVQVLRISTVFASITALTTAFSGLYPVSHKSFVLPARNSKKTSIEMNAEGITAAGEPAATETTDAAIATARSTLSWLEHININVPNHDYILPFYFDLLGLGLDPRRAQNVVEGSKTVWANCGGSQFHLPYGDVAQVIPGQIGLRYSSLEPLKERLEGNSLEHCYESYELGHDPQSQQEHAKIVDKYGNKFYCRGYSDEPNRKYVQPLLSASQTDEYGEVATKYGCDDGVSECRGIAYVEFNCPRGTAAKIAQFYETVLGAVATVIDGDSCVALIGIGDITAEGQAEQYLLYRETTDPIPPYDGHHVAIYVGDTHEDFERVFEQALEANIVWVNTRFKDDVMDIEGARKHNQFRFKHVLDVTTGEVLMELEHEMRSVRHEAWPGMN